MVTCSKVGYRSEADAERASEIMLAYCKSPARIPRRVYLCPRCERWHITSQENPPTEDMRERVKPLDVQCATCGAKRGAPCRTKGTAQPRRAPHPAREQAARRRFA